MVKLDYEKDVLDLKLLNPDYPQARRYVYFQQIKQDWLKLLAKKYVHFLVKNQNSQKTIHLKINSIKQLSLYFTQKNFEEINTFSKEVIVDYELLRSSQIRNTREELNLLRQFFETIQSNKWLDVVNIVNDFNQILGNIPQADFESDLWNIELLFPNQKKTIARTNISFRNIKQDWLKLLLKKYIKYLAQTPNNYNYQYHNLFLNTFNHLSNYLKHNNINQDSWLRQKVITDFISFRKTQVKHSSLNKDITSLNNFFKIAHKYQWLDIPVGIMINEDALKGKVCQSPEIPLTDFDGDIWDLSLLHPNHNARDIKTISFHKIQQDWLKLLLKKHLKYLLEIEKSPSTISHVLTTFINLSSYLTKQGINRDNWLTREVVIDFIFTMSSKFVATTIQAHLGNLSNFFETAHQSEWLDVPLGIIRSEDYPKTPPRKNQDIPENVFKQINDNLHKLPDKYSRMWMVGYFCGMRISELQLCSLNCLKQNSKGEWSITFKRPKTKDDHTLPISRELAKVIQEQQEETKIFKGDNFDFLFYGTTAKNVLSNKNLATAINRLIKEENIRDDNGKLWHFSAHQLRNTRATYLFETGHQMAIISQWLGHKHWITTQGYINENVALRKETAKVQLELTNIRGESVVWESLPKTLQNNPNSHTIDIPNHINTLIYGFCGLPLDQQCPHPKACYSCPSFVARKELLPEYIKIYNELRDKQSLAEQEQQATLSDQFQQEADRLELIINTFGGK
jgi:integrase